MKKTITDYWSIPKGKIEFSPKDIKYTNKILKYISKYRIIIFESVCDFERNMEFISGKFNGVVVIIGNIIEFSKIFSKIYDEHFERFIAIRMKDNANHHLHSYLLILKYNDEKRPYREIREKYTHCPLCNRTSKDYGGKKHHYPSDGTWIRDVWNKISFDKDLVNDPLFLEAIINLYGAKNWHNTLIVKSNIKENYSFIDHGRKYNPTISKKTKGRRTSIIHRNFNQTIINDDCFNAFPFLMEQGCMFDLIFVDPPYNLNKKYKGYKDLKELKEYSDWCIEWAKSAQPLLKEKGLFVILNTPMNILLQLPGLLKYYYYIEDIVWDDLAVPATGKMQPTNYTLLFLSKSPLDIKPSNYQIREPIYCKRNSCLNNKGSFRSGMSIWSDLHRTRQKSRRWGHPCNLPEELVERIISLAQNIYKTEKINILDFFNGVGTTTMAALKRNAISVGIEISKDYFEIQKNRLDNKLFYNPEAEKKQRAPKRNKRFLQNLVAGVLRDNDRIDKGFTMDEQIEWLLNNQILRNEDLKTFSRNSEIFRSVGKGGVPGNRDPYQITLRKYD